MDIDIAYIQRNDPNNQQIVSVISGDVLLLKQINFTSRLLLKTKEQMKRLEAVTNSLYRKL